MLAFIANHQEAIIAVLLLTVVGASIGNYVCSVVHRLPRGQTPFDKHPYCGHCGEFLKPIDLYPIVSYLLTRGRCRYCQGDIPAVYTVIEIICSLVMVGGYFVFGISELFLVQTAAAIMVVALAATYWQARFFSSFLYVVAAALMLLGHALNGEGLFPATSHFTIVMVLGLVGYGIACRLRKQTFRIEKAEAVWGLGLMALASPVTVQNLSWWLLAMGACFAVLGFQRMLITVYMPLCVMCGFALYVAPL